MIDRYTKSALTVIALALSAIAVGQFTPRAHAQGFVCGDNYTPCYVRAREAVPVVVVTPE